MTTPVPISSAPSRGLSPDSSSPVDCLSLAKAKGVVPWRHPRPGNAGSMVAAGCVAALLALAPSFSSASPDQPFARIRPERPAAVEANWAALKMPDGGRTALASLSYLVALDEDWGFGPGFYGAAKGNYGGIFTVGFTGQRRWRLGPHTHLAASLYVGAGGGLSSGQLRYGGGLMLRPELSIRTEQGLWYSGIGVSQVRFPSGNVRGTSLGISVGRAISFASFSPSDAGRHGRFSERTGLGFDEISLSGGVDRPRASSRNRSGQPSTARLGKAGADLRRYVAEGSWWGLEASGAAQGGADGYMEVLANIGQDWALFSPRLRVGGQLAAGLGGGGNVDTGNGWLLRAGPTLRWISPWGPSLRLEGGWMRAPSGRFSTGVLRASVAMTLDRTPSLGSWGGNADADSDAGIVRVQQVGVSVLQLPRVRFKDGRLEPVTHLAVGLSREFSSTLYGTAQAGSAALGSAGAYSFGLFGLGLQSAPLLGSTRVGVEWLVGAGGGGGVRVGGGAVTQAELWAMWNLSERLRLRAGAGQWRTLRGPDQSSPLTHLSLSYAYGTLQR